jgi:hypothetical protein
MFCPNCGNPDQKPETYCRQCGIFLPDLSKPVKTVSPEQHVTANTALSAMTIVTAFTLAILLWSMLGFREDTHPLIYVTAGLLIAIGCWHVQTLWRTLLLRKHLKKNLPPRENMLEGAAFTNRELAQPTFEDVVPANLTERPTKNLSRVKPRSS